VKCTPPKLFACRKNFRQRPFLPPFAVAPLPFAARELTREMDNHHHRRKPGCTHETSTSKPPLKNLPEDVIQTSPSQFTDLFCWVLAASEGEPQPAIFTPPENATELTLINDECPDYISVWVVDGRPVAAAMPLDNFHRVISSSLTK
jgi:hypothetical protein